MIRIFGITTLISLAKELEWHFVYVCICWLTDAYDNIRCAVTECCYDKMNMKCFVLRHSKSYRTEEEEEEKIFIRIIINNNGVIEIHNRVFFLLFNRTHIPTQCSAKQPHIQHSCLLFFLCCECVVRTFWTQRWNMRRAKRSHGLAHEHDMSLGIADEHGKAAKSIVGINCNKNTCPILLKWHVTLWDWNFKFIH